MDHWPKMHSTGTQCRKLLQTDASISHHNRWTRPFPATKPAHQSPATSFVKPHIDTGHWPYLAPKTWPEDFEVLRMSTVSSLLTHGGATTRVATRCPDNMLNPNPTTNSLTVAMVDLTSYPKPDGPPINELGLQLPTLATEVGVTGRGQSSHRMWEGQYFQTHPHREQTPTQPLLRTQENLMRFMSTALLHTATRTQRPQTSRWVIWPLLFLSFAIY